MNSSDRYSLLDTKYSKNFKWTRPLLLLALGLSMLPLLAGAAFLSAWFFLMAAPFLFFYGVIFMALGSFIVAKRSRSFSLHSMPKKQILLVDDQPTSLRLFESILLEGKIDFTIVASGKAAAREIAKNHYDWIVLDYEMEMSGADVLIRADANCEWKNHSESFKPTSVIGYTGTEKAWNLPKLHHFQMVRTLSKKTSLSKLRNQLIETGVLNPSLAA